MCVWQYMTLFKVKNNSNDGDKKNLQKEIGFAYLLIYLSSPILFSFLLVN